MDTVISAAFLALIVNTVCFFVTLMFYPRTDVYQEPYHAHWYALRTMYLLAIPGMVYEFFHMSDIHEDFHPVWRRVQRHLDAKRTNAGEIIAERAFLHNLLRNAPNSDDEATRKQIAASRKRLNTLRRMDDNRASGVFLDTLAPDLSQQEQRLRDSQRIEAEVARQMREDASPSAVRPAWPRWLVKALYRITRRSAS